MNDTLIQVSETGFSIGRSDDHREAGLIKGI